MDDFLAELWRRGPVHVANAVIAGLILAGLLPLVAGVRSLVRTLPRSRAERPQLDNDREVWSLLPLYGGYGAANLAKLMHDVPATDTVWVEIATPDGTRVWSWVTSLGVVQASACREAVKCE